MLHRNIWLLCTFCSRKVLQFFLSELLKFAEKSDCEQVNELNYIHVMLTRHVWPL